MKKYSHDLIILGGGAAGLTAAAGAAQLGVKTALLERERLGGDCLYYGCVPSKTLIQSSSVRRDTQNSPEYGLPLPGIPEVRGESVMNRVHRVISSIEEHDSPERFRSLGVEVIFSNPRFVTPHEVSIGGGKSISAPRIIIATGSSPRLIPIPGLEKTGFITNKEVFSLKTLPRSLVTIGAGPIGVELSQALQRLGVKVTMVSAGPQVLEKEDADMASIVEDRLRSEGVDVILNASITGVTAAGGKKKVNMTVGKKYITVTAEEIFLAAGRIGNTQDLGLENAGVAVEKTFIPVNASLATSAGHIMAIGDVNGSYLFTHVAGAEGSVAVRRAVFRIPAKMDYTSVPWSTYCDPEVASVGYNEKRASEAGLSYRTVEARMEDIDRARAEGAIDGKIKILIDRRDRILGVQIAGRHAGELILPAVLARKKNMKVMDLLGIVYPYPTLGEIYRKAAGDYISPRLFNDRVRKLLRLVYGYRGKK